MFGRKKDHPRAKRPRKSTADQHRIGSNVPTDRKLRPDDVPGSHGAVDDGTENGKAEHVIAVADRTVR